MTTTLFLEHALYALILLSGAAVLIKSFSKGSLSALYLKLCATGVVLGHHGLGVVSFTEGFSLATACVKLALVVLFFFWGTAFSRTYARYPSQKDLVSSALIGSLMFALFLGAVFLLERHLPNAIFNLPQPKPVLIFFASLLALQTLHIVPRATNAKFPSEDTAVEPWLHTIGLALMTLCVILVLVLAPQGGNPSFRVLLVASTASLCWGLLGAVFLKFISMKLDRRMQSTQLFMLTILWCSAIEQLIPWGSLLSSLCAGLLYGQLSSAREREIIGTADKPFSLLTEICLLLAATQAFLPAEFQTTVYLSLGAVCSYALSLLLICTIGRLFGKTINLEFLRVLFSTPPNPLALVCSLPVLLFLAKDHAQSVTLLALYLFILFLLRTLLTIAFELFFAPNQLKKYWIIIGASRLGYEIASFIEGCMSLHVVIIDSNRFCTTKCENRCRLIFSDALFPDDALRAAGIFRAQEVAGVLVITDNEALNLEMTRQWGKVIKNDSIYRWGRLTEDSLELPSNGGNLIWTTLPRPSQVSDALEQERMHLAETIGFEEEIPTEGHGKLLLGAAKSQIVIDPLNTYREMVPILERKLYLLDRE